MRFMFASVGAHGHTIPLLPLAIAAHEAGHDVSFATDEAMHPLVTGSGLTALAAGGSVGAAVEAAVAKTGPGPMVPTEVFGNVLARQTAADLGPLLAEHKPDLVVYEVFNPGAAIAAALAGVPAVGHGIGRLGGGPMWTTITGTWVATARELGVRLPDVDPEHFGDPYLDICPPLLRSVEFPSSVRRIPLRPVPWSHQGALPAVVTDRSSGRPLVYLTLGTAFGKAGLLRQAIDGLAALPVDLLVAAGPAVDAGEIGAVPANVTVEAWVPQAEVLRHVDLVVSHGGSGTMFGALAAGVPHLVLPQGADQFGNAQDLVAVGAARQILPDDVTSDAITEQARGLLADDAARAATAQVAEEIAAMPSPQDTIEHLVALAG